jgi:hypothetical protein
MSALSRYYRGRQGCKGEMWDYKEFGYSPNSGQMSLAAYELLGVGRKLADELIPNFRLSSSAELARGAGADQMGSRQGIHVEG